MAVPFHTEWWETTVVANPMNWDETVLGIDWGETDNAYCLVGYRGKVITQGMISEDRQGADTLIDLLRNYAHPQTGEFPPVAIETPRRLIVWALASAGAPLFPLNPKAVKNYRKTKGRKASKSDPKDAELIANLHRNNHEDHHPLSVTTEHARGITLLYRSRDDAVRFCVRVANRLRSTLVEYHATAMVAFDTDELAENLAPYYILCEALTVEQAKTLTRERIAELAMQPGGRGSRKGLDAFVNRVHEAFQTDALRYAPQFESAFADTVGTELEVLRKAVEHKREISKRLSTAVKAHPMWDLFSPAVGAAEATVAGLIAEMGDDPYRFATADGLMAFAGSAPVSESSGKSNRMVRRDLKGNRLHNALWYWAETAAVRSPGGITYYWSFREAGSAHPHAIRKLMNRLLRNIHYCLRTGTIWDESRVWPNAVTLQEAQAYREECKRQAADWKAAHPKQDKQQRPRRMRRLPPSAPAQPTTTGHAEAASA